MFDDLFASSEVILLHVVACFLDRVKAFVYAFAASHSWVYISPVILSSRAVRCNLGEAYQEENIVGLSRRPVITA
jgi:hypothetical protein